MEKKRKAKVLQVCAIDETLKVLLLPLVDRLQKEGFDVTSCCSAGKNSDELRQKGYKIKNIEIARSINPKSNIRSVLGLYSFLKKEKFDVVHVHTPVAALLARVAAKLARVPVIIYTAHGFYFHDRMPPLQYKVVLNIEKFAGRLLTDYIFTQSDEDRVTAIKEKIIGKDRIRTIGNGVDTANSFNPANIDKAVVLQKREQLGLCESDKVIMFVGRMVREKGILELLEAFNKIEDKNFKLLLVGGLPDSERDKTTYDYINETVKNNANIIATGRRQDINDLLYISDLFVLPSYREGMPRSIIEAMSMGKPVVATNIRGSREEVADGKTGYIVEVGNSEQLKNRIVEILQNPQLQKSMGEKGRARAVELYEEERVLDKEVEVIEDLIKKYIR